MISYNLTDGYSTPLLDLLATAGGLLACPVVFLIEQDDSIADLNCLQGPAQDNYLIKHQFSPPELLYTLEVAIRAFELQRRDYLFSKNHDSLTGLMNGDAFVRRLQNNMKRINKEKKRSLCLNYIDLCKFGLINEKFGHSAGDRVLKIVSERLKSYSQGLNCISRWNGDKFIVMLSVESGKDIEDSAQEVRSIFSNPVSFDQQAVYLDASIGVSQFSGESEPLSTPGDLIDKADMASQKAKSQNSGGCVVFDSATMTYHDICT